MEHIRQDPSLVSGLPGEHEYQTGRLAALCERHARRVGADATVCVVSAPGRTELAGNHTDHNNGRVLCAAVALDVLAIVTPRADTHAYVDSEGFDSLIEVDLADTAARQDERGTPHALLRGVAAAFSEAGRPVSGFDATVTSDVAPGSGLSSSAAFEVFIGTTLAGLPHSGEASLQELTGDDVLFVARAGRRAENEYFGKPCGLMDQLACAHGGIISIDFSGTPPRITPVDFDFSTAGYALAVVDTGGSHADLTEDYASIPAEMQLIARELGGELLAECSKDDIIQNIPRLRRRCGDRAVLRALHFFEENVRVGGMIEALSEGRAHDFLELAQHSGASSSMLLQNYHSAKAPHEQGIALGTELARDFFAACEHPGAARVHGGGFAGTIQTYVPLGQWEAFVARMEEIFGAGSVTRLRLRPEAPRFLAP
ncbi:MAG: galactokinase [bacterium]